VHGQALPASTLAAFAKIKKDNNIVLGNSDGMGVTLDSHETDAALRFKAFGTGYGAKSRSLKA